MVLHQATDSAHAGQYYWALIVLVVVLFAIVPLLAWIWKSCRWHYSRYDYTALEDNQSVHEKLEMERKVLHSQARETAFLTCQYYLKSTGRYVLLEQLGDIGSRQDKFWFVVRDTTLKTERLLTMVPQTLHSPISFSGLSKAALSELFLALQHPYIYPVLDVDVKTITEDEYVVVVLPYNAKGSLKDIIYKARCQEDWHDKYHHRGNGLPVSQVQRLGRQILEALLFLQERGFSPFGHLHCGNVIIQNGVSRLTGFENTLLGYSSRSATTFRKHLRDRCASAIDVMCFGHVLFEMCAGYELNCAHPTSRHLEEIQQQHPHAVEVLNFIFDQDGGQYPSVEDVALLDFFRNMDLREMRSMPVPPLFQTQLSPAIQNLLREVRFFQLSQKATPMVNGVEHDQSQPSTSSFRRHGEIREPDRSSSDDGEKSDVDGVEERETCFTNAALCDRCCSCDGLNVSDCCLRALDRASSPANNNNNNNGGGDCGAKRNRSILENNHEIFVRGTKMSSLGESKGGRLKKRRSNSIGLNAAAAAVDDVDVSVLSPLLACSSSSRSSMGDSRLSSPYVSTLDVTNPGAVGRSSAGEEFHTPPNSPLVASNARRRLEDVPLVSVVTPSNDDDDGRDSNESLRWCGRDNRV